MSRPIRMRSSGQRWSGISARRRARRFWLKRAQSLEFDPRADVKSFEDLTLFPNVTNELRDVRAQDLIPRGYGPHPEVVGVFESGGTTGAPKRIVMLRDWCDRMLAWQVAHLDARGVPRDRDWLVAVSERAAHGRRADDARQAAALGGLRFTIDMDPRWVKKLIAAGKTDEADAYAEHLIDQAAFVLQTQDIGVLSSHAAAAGAAGAARRPRRAGSREGADDRVGRGAHGRRHPAPVPHRGLPRARRWTGATEARWCSAAAAERQDLTDDDPCIFDPFSPYITFSVVEPDTGRKVAYGERGQVVMNHVSKSFLLPNNLERDMATRIRPPEGQIGDSVADVTPVAQFDDETVIEGVY